MRRVGILATLAVPVFVAGTALAYDMGSRPHRSSEAGTYSGTAPGGTGSGAGFMGEHVMSGTVTEIDQDQGKISVSAEGHDLDLHFPNSALQNLKKGDRVTIQMAIKPASGRTGGATSGYGAERPASESGTRPSGGRRGTD